MIEPSLAELWPRRFKTVPILGEFPEASGKMAKFKVPYLTATKYLDQLVEGGFLYKQKVGRSNYYLNVPLFRILNGETMQGGEQ